MTPHEQNGLSLLEIMIVIGLLAVISGFTIPLGLNFLRDESLVSTGNDLVQVLRLAQVNTQQGKFDSQWGVHVQDTTYTFFRGSTYVGRDSSFDENYDVSGLYFATSTDIIFTQPEGFPTVTNQFEITDGKRTRLIQVNSLGRINLTAPETFGGS